MKQFLKQLYDNTTLGYWLLSPLKVLYHLYWFIVDTLPQYYLYHLVPEKTFLKKNFREKMGKELDLENPKTLNEKIQWLKLNDRRPLHTVCADKYAVREYIKEKIGERYLVPLIYHTDNPADIVAENFPDFPCIIKTNHGQGGGIIVTDKSKIDWKHVQKILARSLKNNFYYQTKEWQYKNIVPKILVEELLVDSNGHILKDFKFLCINNKVEMIHVDQNKEIKHQRNNYSTNWELLPVFWPKYLENGKNIDRPFKLNEMIELAEILSKPFRFVRIDFYSFDKKVYFGEITFHPTGGLGKFEPPEWDRKLGDKLIL